MTNSTRGRSARRIHRFARYVSLLAVGLLLLPAGCVTTAQLEEQARIAKQAEARRNVGMDHLAKGRTAMAIRELQHAESLDSEDPLTMLWLGEAFRRKGLLEEAEHCTLRAHTLDPEDQQVRLNLSALYIQMERYDSAIEYAQGLIDDPTFSAPWRAYTNRGWAELQAKRLVDANESFQKALDYRSDYWPALLNLGILANMNGHRAEAVRYFERALETNLGYNAKAELNYRLGELYVSLGRRARAVQHFQTAAESAPSGTWGEQSRNYLELLAPAPRGGVASEPARGRNRHGWRNQ